MVTQAKPDPTKSNQSMIHRAPWVAADVASEIHGDTQGIIEDGAAFVSGGLIKAVGKFKEIIKDFGSYPIQEHECGVLTPALINSHCHLELSYLNFTEPGIGQPVYNGDPTLWIRDLLKARDNFSHNEIDAEKQILSNGSQILQHMSAEGVGFIGDIGNSLASRLIGRGISFCLNY
jgi:cytosine/adenosine deaminase-related metal-dependent hydrolase